MADNSLTGTEIVEASLGQVPSANQAATAGTAAPTGAAGGSLTGTYPSPSLADGAVTTAKLGADAVTGAKVADGSLTGSDLQAGSVSGTQVTDLSIGAADLQAGAITPGKLGTITRRVASVTIAGGTGQNGAYITGEQTVNCQAGELALTGEAYWAGQADEELFISEFIFGHDTNDRPVSLHVTGGNDSGQDRLMNVAVYCLSA